MVSTSYRELAPTAASSFGGLLPILEPRISRIVALATQYDARRARGSTKRNACFSCGADKYLLSRMDTKFS